MGLFKDYVSQTRKPEGFLGKMMLSGMNSGHAKMADWGFTHLPSVVPTKAIDLGCGGAMERSFYVGEGITEEDIKVKYEHGVLSLTIPRRQHPIPVLNRDGVCHFREKRRLPIRGGTLVWPVEL